MSDSPTINGQSTTQAKGPTWIQTLVLLFVSGLIVFAVTRQIYLGDVQTDVTSRSDTAAPSPKPQDEQLEVNTAMLESLLSLDSNKNDPATMSLLANEYFANQQYAEAADLYRRLSDIDPGNVDLLNNLGLTLQYIDNSEEALAVLTKGSMLDPGHQRIWLTLGYVNKELGKFDEARSALETAVAINPDSDVGKSASNMLAEL